MTNCMTNWYDESEHQSQVADIIKHPQIITRAGSLCITSAVDSKGDQSDYPQGSRDGLYLTQSC